MKFFNCFVYIFKHIRTITTSKMNNNTECSICLEKVDCVNCTVTSCGHSFHTNCLMTNVLHNGVGCPYCRQKLADEVKYANDDDIASSDWGAWTNQELYGDRELAGFRMFHQRVNGEEVEEVEDEDDDEEDQEDDTDQIIRPSPAFIARKLSDQGVTMEDLVKIMLGDHEEYEDLHENPSIQLLEGELFGKFRIIISNYKDGDEPSPSAITSSEEVSDSSPLIHIVGENSTFIGYPANIRRRVRQRLPFNEDLFN